MSAELIAILAVGVAVAGIVFNGQRTTRQDIKELRADLDGRLRAVEHGQAKIEGLLEGLREAISGRNAA